MRRERVLLSLSVHRRRVTRRLRRLRRQPCRAGRQAEVTRQRERTVPRCELHGGDGAAVGFADLRVENGLATEFRPEDVDDAEAQRRLGVRRLLIRLMIPLRRRHVTTVRRRHASMTMMTTMADSQSQRVRVHGHEGHAHLSSVRRSVLVRGETRMDGDGRRESASRGRGCKTATHAFTAHLSSTSALPLQADSASVSIRITLFHASPRRTLTRRPARGGSAS